MDLRAQTVALGQPTISRTSFVPRLPVSVIERVEQSGAMTAMGLVLAIHRQMAMRRRQSTPLNAAIWKAAGSPSKKRREVILRNLAKIPDVFVLQRSRSLQGFYRVERGELWIMKL
jgi:hypothetical protein